MGRHNIRGLFAQIDICSISFMFSGVPNTRHGPTSVCYERPTEVRIQWPLISASYSFIATKSLATNN